LNKDKAKKRPGLEKSAKSYSNVKDQKNIASKCQISMSNSCQK
jgi:hypothetical protein